MSVSRSWYYARPSVQQRAHKDVELRDAIERIVLEFPGYGYRRVTAELRREGWSCEPQASLEDHERGVACVPAKAPLCANHRFGPLLWELSESPQRCGTRWLLSELDLGHHLRAATHELLLAGGHLGRLLPKVRGLAPLSRFIDTHLRLSAFEMALASRRPAVGLIHHSDQGLQYASNEYTCKAGGCGRAD